MITKLREMAPMMMIVILVAFVGGTIFLDWGMNVMGQGPVTEAGRINGKKIPLDQFDRLVNLERTNMQQQGSGNIPPQQYRAVPARVWSQEVGRVLLDGVVSDMRLEAAEEAVFQYLRRNPLQGFDADPTFQTDGVFDTAKYEQWLRTEHTYRAYPFMLEHVGRVSGQIPYMKINALLKAGVFVSPSEAAFEFAQRNEKASFEFFKAPIDSFRAGIEETRVTDNMINEYYAANRSRFEADDQVDLYFVKLPKIATESDIELNRAALEDVKRRIETGGATFEAEAAVSDHEPTASSGGDLGWFEKGGLRIDNINFPALEEAAFALDSGAISDPIRTALGYHIIKVDERGEPDSLGNFRIKARHILIKDSPSNETLDLLSSKAEELRRDILNKGIAVASQAEPSAIFDSTGFFSRGALPPKVGYLSGSGVFAFGARRQRGDVSEALDGTDGVYILVVKEQTKKGVLPLPVVRDRIVEALRDTLAARDARAYAQNILERVRGGATLEEIRASDGKIVAGLAEEQIADGYNPQLGHASRTAAVALSLPEGAVSGVIEDRNGFSVVRVTKRSEVLESDPASPQVKRAADMARTLGRQQVLDGWFASLRGNAKIVSNMDRFYLD